MTPADAAGPSSGAAERRLAWFDVSAGAAGDMLCGALVDAGVPLSVLQSAVDAVAPGAVAWQEQTVTRAGLRATAVHPEVRDVDPPHRSWSELHTRLEQARLEPAVRARAIHVFQRLAEAEAHAHQVAVSQVEFHEVGGLDAIADVVGASAALQHLGVAEVSASPLALGSGRVATRHGDLPVPVPAVVQLCAGWQVAAVGEGELATPTGAALVTSLASDCQGLPPMLMHAAGVGAGSRDVAARPNVVRVVIGSSVAAPAKAHRTTEIALEANIDDLDPRLWPTVLQALLAGGASDAWVTPVVMKKGRPAHTLSVLAPPERTEALRRVVFATTSTIGLREHAVTKHALARTVVDVDVDGEPVRVKVAVADGRVVHATPEFDDVAAIAERQSRPHRDVLETAMARVDRAGLVPGAPAP